MEFEGIGIYGATLGDEGEYFTQIDINDEEDFHKSLDEMKGIFGQDVILVRMEA